MIKSLLNWPFRPKKLDKAVTKKLYSMFHESVTLLHKVCYNEDYTKYSQSTRDLARVAYKKACDAMRVNLPRILRKRMSDDDLNIQINSMFMDIMNCLQLDSSMDEMELRDYER